MKKIRHILNKGALLNYALCIMNCALIVSCSSNEDLGDGTLSGNGKTPLQIEATLSTGTGVTRAVGKQFESGDLLKAYIRHIIGDTKGNYTSVDVGTDKAPKLVTLTKGSIAMTGEATTLETTDLSPIYWDDFSISTSDGSTDLRTSGHGLQSYYGYCYNGGTPTTALNETTGVLGWTVQTNQSVAADFQHSDLLWSPEQEKVTYAHANAVEGAHGTMTIPYTHAMSEVTVTINAEDGFSGSPLTSTILTLYGMKTTATLTAPTSTIVTGDGTANITMCGSTNSSGLTRTYTAIVAPGTKLKVGEKLLDITNADGNNYTLNITGTDAMLKNDAWANGHEVKNDDGTYILTKSGYNYHLNVTLKKAKIEVLATITDWTDVTATGNGEINFPNNVVSIDVTGGNFKNASSFQLFYLASTTANANASTRTNDVFDDLTQVFTYEKSVNKWTTNPPIYWPNKNTNYYFRALAYFMGDTGDNEIVNINSTAVSQGTIAEHHDILWGTTPAHNNNNFAAGQAIPPRTGDVPIAFEHAMSKVTFNLETADGDASSVNSPAVNLTDATIAVSNLATSGTILIENGTITPGSTVTTAIPAATSIENLIVVPQTIGNTAIVTITLNDGTTYKLQLNTCKDSSNNPIGAWERGKNYTYTIHLEKEQIAFRALIKDWEDVTGSGNANLEWD